MKKIIKLKNLTPLHMGTGKENYDFSASHLQSDTLTAALAAIRVQLGKKDDINEFLNSFTISSAFPYVGNRYFFPMPLGKMDVEVSDAEAYVIKKSLKSIEYVEFSLWEKLIRGESLRVSRSQLQNNFLIDSNVNCSFNKPYKSQVNQRVTVPREEGPDAEPFFFEWTYFNQSSGLFCLLSCAEKITDEIIALFAELGENGIGTDRNVGGGKFEIEVINFDMPQIESPNANLLLSLYIPTPEEMNILNLESSRYELVERGGYISGSEDTRFRHLRKKSIYMFNYGSVFHTTSTLTGKVVDLRPVWNDASLHPVYRSGKPFIIPMKYKNYEPHQN